jgi:hypothetical protein
MTTANAARKGRCRDVSTAHTVIIERIFSHPNTKNAKIVQTLPAQSRSPPQISHFE